jgi:monoamine oxidase
LVPIHAVVRQVEAYPIARQLAENVGTLDPYSLAQALNRAVAMFCKLRYSSMEMRREAERVAADFLDEVEGYLTGA